MGEICVTQLGNKSVVWHRVKCLREVSGQDNGAIRGSELIEALHRHVHYWEQGGGGGALVAKTMLSIREGQVVLEVGEEQPLKHLSSRAKKRDRSVGCAGVSGFTGFRDGGNGGSLPDGRNVGSSHRKIEESAQIGDALRAQVSKMEDGEPVRTRSGGRARNPNGIAEEFRCERSEAGIYGVAGVVWTPYFWLWGRR